MKNGRIQCDFTLLRNGGKKQLLGQKVFLTLMENNFPIVASIPGSSTYSKTGVRISF